jgi:hypothetical protein
MRESNLKANDRRLHSLSRLGYLMTLFALIVTCFSSNPALGIQPSRSDGSAAHSEAPRLGFLPPENPPANEPPIPNYYNECAAQKTVDNSVSCTEVALAAIDNARVNEGVRPMSFDLKAFETMAPSEQLFVIVNLERIDRGLQPVKYVTTQLDQFAQTGADDSTDPTSPHTLTGGATVSSWGSIWAVGIPNALIANYFWMYDDGIGSPNGDCTSARAHGCWVHRDIIFMPDARSGCYLAMGVGLDDVARGISYADLLVQGCGAVPGDVTLTWANVESALGGTKHFNVSTQSLLPPSDYASSYSDWLETENASTSYSWSITSGTLPPGFALSSAGQLTGPNSDPTPSYSFTVTASETGAPSITASKSFSLGSGESPGSTTTTTTTLSTTTTTPLMTTTTTTPSSTTTTPVKMTTATIHHVSIPSAPRIRVTSPTKGDVSVIIVGSVNSHGDAIVEFQTSIDTSIWHKISRLGNGTFLIRHLRSGKSYGIRLRAVSKAGVGHPSQEMSLRVK